VSWHLPILFYHKINIPDPRAKSQGLYVPPANFARQMRYLAENGYLCLTLEQAIKSMLEGKPLPKKAVVITFDDGYLDNYTQAFPVLQKWGFTATIFIASRMIGGKSSWPGREQVAEPLMSWEHIRRMQQYGISFGSHTCRHKVLTELPPAELMEELRRSKEELEDGLRAPVTTFCYPFGEYNPFVEEKVQEAGYLCACSAERGNVHRLAERFRLKRVFVWPDTSVERFRYYLSVGYDLEHSWKRFKKRVRRFVRNGCLSRRSGDG